MVLVLVDPIDILFLKNFLDLFIIYLFTFIFGCVGSQLRHAGSASRHVGSFVAVRGLLSSCGGGFSLSSCGVWAPERVGPVVCGTWALAEVREFSSCGMQA